MIRRISRRGVRFVAGWEGFRSCPYWDALGGVWTRGYGETKNISRNSPCVSEADARRELRRRLNRDFIPYIPRRFRMKRQEVDALASFAYNNGPAAVNDPHFSTLARRLRSKEGKSFRRRKRIYRDELPKWVYAGGFYVEGLAKRRQAEVRLACWGDYSGKP